MKRRPLLNVIKSFSWFLKPVILFCLGVGLSFTTTIFFVDKAVSYDVIPSPQQELSTEGFTVIAIPEDDLFGQGKKYLDVGNYAQALNEYLQVLGIERIVGHENKCKFAEKAIAETDNFPERRVEILQDLGRIFYNIGCWENAQASVNEILSYNAERPKNSQGYVTESEAYLVLGDVFQAQSEEKQNKYDRTRSIDGDLQEAIEYAQKSLTNYGRAIVNTASSEEPEARLIGIEVQINRLNLITGVEKWLYDATELINKENFLPQPIIAAETGEIEKIKEDFPFQEHDLKKLEVQLLVIKQLWQGLEELNSLTLDEDLQVRVINNLIKLPELLDKIAKPYEKEEEKKKPIFLLGENILRSIEREAQTITHKITKSKVLGSCGKWYENKQHPDLPKAQSLTEKALGIAQSRQVWELAYDWQWQLGRIYKAEAEGNPQRQKKYYTKAIKAYDAAVKSVEYLRGELLSAQREVQFTFRDSVEDVYREYIALQLSEPVQKMDISKIATQTPQELIASLQLAELENFLECSLASLRGNEENEATEENKQSIADVKAPSTAIVYPIILEDGIKILLKLPSQKDVEVYPKAGSIYVENNKVDAKDINLTLKKLRYNLEQPFFSNEGRATSHLVYEWVIAPIKDALDKAGDIDTLVFVLDDALRNVPMSALLDQNSRYLVEDYAIAVSLGDWEVSEPKSNDISSALLAYISDDPKLDKNDDFGPLEFTKKEVEQVGKILEGSQISVEKLENRAFTKERLETEINSSSYDLVHLATHGQFGSSREDTFLITAKEVEGHEKADINDLDGLLKSGNSSQIDLLVLSACETAEGDDREVLGIAGIAVQAHARSTLATLWSVDDSYSAKFAKQFYGAWENEKTDHKTQVKALQEAQVKQIKSYSPSDWSPYILVRDWR